MNTTRGQRLRLARTRFYRSARAAAQEMGVPVATYNAHERAGSPGGRDYNTDDAQRYGRKFSVAPEWLMMGIGAAPVLPGLADSTVKFGDADEPPSSSPMVKVKGYVGAGAEAHFYAVAQGDFDEVPAPEGATADTVAVEIRGSSLGELFDRWLVFYDEVRRPITPDLVGRICVVGLSDERVLIKKVKKGRRQGRYSLISAHEPPIEDVEIDWAAPVKLMAPR